MKRVWARRAAAVLTSFVALTAIGGGAAMLSGADKFPLEWLQGTPFSSYTLPALVLAVAVGGSSLVAAVLLWAGHQAGAVAALLAGASLAGYVAVEAAILRQTPPGPTLTEGLYFGLGLAIMGLAVYLWRAGSRSLSDA